MMRRLRATCLRFGGMFRKQRRDAELAAELESHLQLHTEDNLRAGLTPEEARRRALVQLGGVEQTKEIYRDRRSVPWLETFWQDLQFGARMLRKNPGFTAVAVITLALGIGANTAIFSVVNAVLLRPLPYANPSRLIDLREDSRANGPLSVSYPDFQDWQRQQTVFTRLAIYRRSGFSFTGKGAPERLTGGIVSSEFFPLLGLKPELGRIFSAEDDRPGSAPAVVLSHALWLRRFGGDPNILGATLVLDTVPYTVVGVLEDVSSLPHRAEFWTSLGRTAARPEFNRRANHMGFSALGSLKPGVTLDRARAEMETVTSRLAAQFPDSNKGEDVHLAPMLETLVGEYRRGLLLLAGAVGLVLLIACANLANLLLARGAVRERELAVRSALGAARGRLIRQMLTESALLALLGGALGVLLAVLGRGAILELAPPGVARFQDTRIDGAVCAFALGISLVAGLLFGSWPAWKLARTDLRGAMQERGRGASDGIASQRLRQTLVTSEVALTLALLVSAGLLVRSLLRTEAVPLGFNPDGLLLAVMDLSPAQFTADTPDRASKANAFFDELLSRVRALPAVRVAALDSSPPLDVGWESNFDVEGHAPFAPGEAPSAEISVVDSDYFRLMQIPVLRGRPFMREDTTHGLPVVIIDEAFAKHFWPGGDALGKHVRFWSKSPHETMFTIVGVVPTLRLYGYSEEPRFLQVYFPEAQIGETNPTLLVRGAGDPAALVEPIRQIAFQLDPADPLFAVRTMQSDLKDSMSSPRLLAALLGIFAALALILAAVGIYGVVSYGVSQRGREIGIRIALGARPADVVKMVLAQGARPALAGVTLGLAGSLAASRLLESLLYRVSPTDPLTFALVALLLIVVVLAACWIPARRATKVDPILALRDE